MLWDGIKSDGGRFLKLVDGIVDSVKNQEILDDALPDSIPLDLCGNKIPRYAIDSCYQ